MTKSVKSTNWNLKIGIFIVAIYLLAALIGVVLSSTDLWLDSFSPFLAPSFTHLLGTDNYGRDIFLALVMATKNSIFVAAFSGIMGLIYGSVLGLYAAYHGGAWAEFLTKVNEIVFAFPGLVLAILLCAVMGNNIVVCAIAIGIFNIPVFFRISYIAALPYVTRENVIAAKIYSKPDYLIVFEHILPNITTILISQLMIQAALAVSAESALSYIGLGVQPPFPSWGRMIYDAQSWLESAPQLVIYPSLAIFGLVFGLYRLSEGIKNHNRNKPLAKAGVKNG